VREIVIGHPLGIADIITLISLLQPESTVKFQQQLGEELMTTQLSARPEIVDDLVAIANQFKPHSNVVNVQEYGSGNINGTFLVTLDSLNEPYFILQRINTSVFRQPELIMQNMCTFTQHVCDRLQRDCPHPSRRWDVPYVLFNQDGQACWTDANGNCWRAISFIDAAQTFDTIQNSNHAQEIGYALGMFHNLISDLPAERLADTLEGFHITPRYIQQYEAVLATCHLPESPHVSYCVQFIRDRKAWASVLENAKAEGHLQVRLMHGDPKINNVMIDATTGYAIGMIDLDTVKPGLVHYDIGDCLRSGCNRLGEETDQWDHVYFDANLCQSILQGYLAVGRNFLTENDYRYLYDAIRLIAFELGLRFFTDYLAGNIYFKTKYPDHNLARAIVQFKLTQSIESQETEIRAIIQDLR
jgi:Ser/Thr protein kinase RdoA (MazF antagonist)